MTLEKIKTLWKKPWFRNAIFFLLLAVVFFSGAPRWVSVQLTRFRLAKPSPVMEPIPDSLSVYRFKYIIEEPMGEQVELQDFKGKPVFINFWASWCVPCLAEFASMEELMEELPEVTFIFVTAEERPAFEKYLGRTSHPLRFYRQATPAPPAFSHEAIPASYVLNSDGRVVYKHVGAADWGSKEIAETIRKHLR